MDARIREDHVAPSTNEVSIDTLVDPRDQALSHAVLQAVLDGDYERARRLAEEWRDLEGEEAACAPTGQMRDGDATSGPDVASQERIGVSEERLDRVDCALGGHDQFVRCGSSMRATSAMASLPGAGVHAHLAAATAWERRRSSRCTPGCRTSRRCAW
jgi:hypothetical protein